MTDQEAMTTAYRNFIPEWKRGDDEDQVTVLNLVAAKGPVEIVHLLNTTTLSHHRVREILRVLEELNIVKSTPDGVTLTTSFVEVLAEVRDVGGFSIRTDGGSGKGGGNSGSGTCDIAHRLFAAELDDADLDHSESDEERAPNYVVTPTGLRVNRLFAVGVLTEVESVNEQALRGRVVDPTGAFVTYAGQHQPDEAAFLNRTTPPAFVALTGKARTFRPEDSELVYTSVRPESLATVDADTRDRWEVSAAKATLRRLAVFERALDLELTGDGLRKWLASAGVPVALASGIPLAIDHYDTGERYLAAVRRLAMDTLEVVANEREEVRALDAAPGDPGDVDLDSLPATPYDLSAAFGRNAGSPADSTRNSDNNRSKDLDSGTESVAAPGKDTDGNGDRAIHDEQNESPLPISPSRDPIGRPTENLPVPDASAVASPPRQSIDRDDLQLGETIDQGGQATVRLATLSESDEQVALREPLGSGSIDRSTIETFLNRADVWATVDDRERRFNYFAQSEHVVGIIDTGDHLPWIATEYMDGGDLDGLLDQHPNGLPVEQALWIGECICKGAEVAHKTGIAHLDIKPENVLLTETDGWPWPKVADWGLARRLAAETGTTDGVSVEYAAPEQLDREAFGEPDTLSDVYGIGATVYELLTGAPPYTDSPLEVIQATTTPEAPSSIRPEVPRVVDRIVGRALRAEKTDRYDGVAAFARALKGARTGGPLPPSVTAGSGRSTVAREDDAENAPETDPIPTGDTDTDSTTVPRDGSDEASENSDSGDEASDSTSDEGEQVRYCPECERTFTERGRVGDVCPECRRGYLTLSNRPQDQTASTDDSSSSQTPSTSVKWPTFQQNTARTGTFCTSSYSKKKDGYTGELELLWSVEIEGEELGNPLITENAVYIVAREEGFDGTLYALDQGSGEKNWTLSVQTDRTAPMTPVLKNDTVYIPGNRKLYSIDIKSREINWSHTVRGARSHPTIGEEMVYLGDRDGLHAFDLHSADRGWSLETEHDVNTCPTYYDGTVVVGSRYGPLHAVSSNGERKWTVDFPSGRQHHVTAAAKDGILYTGVRRSYEDDLYAFDIETGNKLWGVNTPDLSGQVSTMPVVTEEQLFVVTNQGRTGELHAIDLNTRESTWKVDMEGKLNSPPAITTKSVYMCCPDGTLYVCDKQNGQIRDKFTVPTSDSEGLLPSMGPPVIVDDMLCLTGNKNTIVACRRTD